MANFFKDRLAQHPGRITLTPTGGSNEYDVDRAEGTITEAGTPFNALTFNDMLDKYGMWYGTSSSAATTAAKTVTCNGFTLVTGATIAVKFTYANTYNGQITLNVNGTGAKNVYDYGQFYDGYSRCAWDANQVMIFVYDGTRYILCNGDIITAAELTALETALGISGGGGTRASRLYNIINKMITQTPMTITQLNSSSIDGYIVGDIAIVTVHSTGNVASGTWVNIGKIAAGQRPRDGLFGLVGNGSVNGFGKIFITADGDIRAYHVLGSTQALIGATLIYAVYHS